MKKVFTEVNKSHMVENKINYVYHMQHVNRVSVTIYRFYNSFSINTIFTEEYFNAFIPPYAPTKLNETCHNRNTVQEF